MSTAKKSKTFKKQSKKDMAKEVYAKLEIALLGYKNGLKKGGFEKSLQKASKSFAENIRKLYQKQSRKLKDIRSELKSGKSDKTKK